MNYIKHLTGFFEKVAGDRLLNPTHISLYIALFQFWNCNRFKNPISISRDEVMRISKISSKVTYHKCLKALHSQGYIKYEPSYNPFKGSHVFLFNFSDDLKPLQKTERTSKSNFEPVIEHVLNKSQTSTETSPELVDKLVLIPSINNTNNLNIPNIEKSLNGQAHENEIEDSGSGFNSATQNEMLERTHNEKEKPSFPAFTDYSAKKTESGGQKSSAKKEKEISLTLADANGEQNENGQEKEAVEFIRQVFSRSEKKPPEFEKSITIPVMAEVLDFFRQQDFPEIEGNKFFNYFQSIGWLVGGKTPMVDWPAAARNWMLNAPKYSTNERTDRTKHLDNSAGKDYSEPL